MDLHRGINNFSAYLIYFHLRALSVLRVEPTYFVRPPSTFSVSAAAA